MPRRLVSSYKWTKEMCVQLIREYKEWPILWNVNHPCYYNHAKKYPVWQKIGEAMQKPPLECKRKISALLTGFRYEKSRIARNVHNPEKEWFAYKHMTFLTQRRKPKKKHQSIRIRTPNSDEAENPDGANAPNKNHGMESVIGSSDEAAATYVFTEGTHDDFAVKIERDDNDTNKENEQTITSSVELDPEYQPGPSGTQVDLKSILEMQKIIDDEVDSFINFIQSKMKTYTLAKLHEVEREICEVLFKADKTHGNSILGSQ